MSINPWRPWAYAPGYIVSHGGQLWKSRRVTGTGEAPGESDAWAAVQLVEDSASGARAVPKAALAQALDTRIGSGI